MTFRIAGFREIPVTFEDLLYRASRVIMWRASGNRINREGFPTHTEQEGISIIPFSLSLKKKNSIPDGLVAQMQLVGCLEHGKKAKSTISKENAVKIGNKMERKSLTQLFYISLATAAA